MVLLIWGVLALLMGAVDPGAVTAPSTCHADADWNQPARPLHIYGNSWFVGTCGLSSILITSEGGHILIDGDTARAAPLIEANIRALGFRVEDVRYILNSHEHLDHVGGIAQLQRDSGAVVLSRAAAALRRGRGDRSDPQFLTAGPFPPITATRPLEDHATIKIGALELTAHATPGHTPGSTSWTWRSCENGRCLDLVYADSLTAISDKVYRYSDEGSHPGALAAFRASIATVAALRCDILLTPHPDASHMWERFGESATAPLVDQAACRRYAETAATNLDARLAGEAHDANR